MGRRRRLARELDAGAPARGRAGAGGLPTDVPIAAGHTATDQVETILYRLAASPGRRALLGMAPRDGAPGASAACLHARADRRLLSRARPHVAGGLQQRQRALRARASTQSARAGTRHGASRRATECAAHRRAAARGGRGAGRPPRRRAAGCIEHRPRAPGGAARQRSGVWWWCAWPSRRPGTYVPQAGDRVQELLALARRGGRAELHVGGLVGAVIEDGHLRMVRLPPRH